MEDKISKFLKSKVQKVTNYFDPSSNGGNNFWSTNVAKGLGEVQNRFNSGELIKPFQTKPNDGFIPQVQKTLANIPIGMANSVYGKGLTSTSSDMFNNFRNVIQDKPITPYSQLNSGLSKIGYQAAATIDPSSVARTQAPNLGNLKQTFGNAASGVMPIVDAYVPKGVTGFAKEALDQTGKQSIKSFIKEALIKNAKPGAAYGFLTGLADSKDEENNLQYLFNVGANTAVGAALSSLLGTAIETGPFAYQKTKNKIASVISQRFGVTPKVAEEQAGKFIRNELGQFAGVRKPVATIREIPQYEGGKLVGVTRVKDSAAQQDAKFYGDIREALGLPRNGVKNPMLDASGEINVGLKTRAVTPEERIKTQEMFNKLSLEEQAKYNQQGVGGIQVAKSPQQILQEIGSPKNGPQGKVLSQDELNVLGDYLKQSGDDSMRGTVYKSYGGGRDVVFGVVKDRQFKGSKEYLVMNDSGANKGRFRLHSTPISKSDIISSPSVGVDNTKVHPFVQDMEANKGMPKNWNEGLGTVVGASKNEKLNAQFMETDPSKGEIKSLTGDLGGIKSSFADWVNARKASQVEGVIKAKDFQDLDAEGIKGFLDFQASDKTGKFSKFKDYFDQKFSEAKKAGIDMNYRKDYLPQLWANDPSEVEQVFGRSFSMKPSFTMEAVLKSYEQGINHGLTPRFQKMSDLVSWYEKTANKSIADHNFFSTLNKEGFILPSGKAPRDWVTLAPDNFPKVRVSTTEGNYTGTYKAPQEVADMINNYLQEPRFEFLQKVADYASSAKNRMLSFGIPGTAFNAHGFNILARSVMSNPSKGVKTLAYMVNPNLAKSALETNLTKAPFAIRNGLTLGTEVASKLADEPVGVRSKIGAKWSELFEEGLFQKMLPSLKLDKFYEVFEGYKKDMPEKEAAREAAKFTNNLFGGINWEELGKSRDMQNLKRALILAPDWLETNINLGKNIPKSLVNFKDPKLQAYRKFAAGAMGTYVSANVLNKIMSGHWMYENDSGNTFNLDTGTYTPDGQKRYVRLFGTAADFVRIPFDVTMGLAKGDPSVAFRAVRNRLSALASPVVGLTTNTDYLGNKIYGRDKYGNEMSPLQSVQGIGSELSTALGVPAFTKNIADIATGKQGLEQGLTAAIELPTRYSGGPISSAQKQISEISGLKGEDLYNLSKELKGQKKFSDNQISAIRGDKTALQTILNAREQNTRINDMKQQLEGQTDQVLSDGDMVVYADSQGKTHVVNPVAHDAVIYGPLSSSPTLADLQMSKKVSAISSKMNDLVTLAELGKITQQDAVAQITQLQELKKTLQTIRASIKPKKARIAKPKFKKVKVARAKPIKLKTIKIRKV